MTQNADLVGHPVVEVSCRRNHRRVIHGGEIPAYGVPLCLECDGPRVMFPVAARSCFCDRVVPPIGSSGAPDAD